MMVEASRGHRMGAAVGALLLAMACGGAGRPPAETAGGGTTEAPGTTAAPGTTVTADTGLSVAAVFPGSVTDADYNALGFLALESLREEMGATVAHSENVAVPDVERVIREYVAEGFEVVWTHGGQFFEATSNLAVESPEVTFIAEFDAPPEDPPPNLWVIDRNFHVGFYPIGALAGMVTRTGRVGYVGGLSLPFSYAEVHAMEQASSDLGLDVRIQPVWTGDFNDPAAGRQLAGQLLAQNVDVVVGSLNLGMVGVFEAVKAEPAGEAWVTAKYTDKSEFAPEHYVTSVLYDFTGPLRQIVERIQAGETTGYYPLGFDTGVELQLPLQNVGPEVEEELLPVIEGVESGEIEVEKNTTPIDQ